jgi:D-alanyl-D-alanine carboxypeptidase
MTNDSSRCPVAVPAGPMFLALCALLAGACEEAPTAPPNTAVERGLQQVLDRAVAKPGVLLPGATIHYRDPDHAAWSGSAGLAEISSGTPMEARHQIRAGSVLKTFLATVTLQHVEEGTLSLDQTLPAMLPATVTDRIAGADRITLRMLLGHTSGIPEWVTEEVHAAVVADPAHIWSVEEAIDIASHRPATFPAGTSWSYSNTNYTLVGLVLDRAGGKSWRAQVRERVLVRLGLTSTQLPEPGDHSTSGPYAHGYQEVRGTVMDLSGADPSMAGAAGGHAMVTTVRDLSRFLDALLEGRLFARSDTLARMTTMIEAPHESGLPHRYGLGLESFEMPGGVAVIGHSGSTGGYAVMMFRVPQRRTTLVTAVNTNDLFTNALEVFIPSLQVITAEGQSSSK